MMMISTFKSSSFNNSKLVEVQTSEVTLKLHQSTWARKIFCADQSKSDEQDLRASFVKTQKYERGGGVEIKNNNILFYGHNS
jgi:hypothetical protein